VRPNSTCDKERIMLYDLPAGPAIVVVGPDDTRWWASLGEDPAGRHALVIGDPTAPRGAVVIAGSLPDIGAYLHPLHAALTGTVQEAYARLTRSPGSEQPREHHAPLDPSASEPRTAVDLVTLPHTGIRVPDPSLRVSSYRELPTPDGVAYTATVQLRRVAVGTIHNDGHGGPTTYVPSSNVFGHRQLADFVAASRTPDGQPITQELLLDELITEFENAAHVTGAIRAGRSPVRLMAPLGAGDELADTYYTAHRTTAAQVTTPGQRGALAAQLRRRAVVEGAWWQLWTGQRWEDLTPPPQPHHGGRAL
jgi:hypothetical protein